MSNPGLLPDPSLAPPWERLTPVALTGGASLDGNDVILASSAGPLRITISELGIRLRAGSEVSEAYGILHKPPATLAPQLHEADTQSISFSAGDWCFECEREPFVFRALHRDRCFARSASDGHFVREHRLPPLHRSDDGWLLSLELAPGEAVYGLGEKWGSLNHRGEYLRSFNHDALGVNAERSYKNTPFCWSPRGWGVFTHTPAPVSHSVGFAPWSQRAYVLQLEDEALDLWLLAAGSPSELLRQYAELTGYSRAPPDWSLGTILSRAYYRTAEELLATAREVRARDMPCDTITLDGRAWQDTGTRFKFEWDDSRYPDPDTVMAELKALNFRVCLWEYPLISERSPLYQQFAEADWLLRDRRNDKPYRYQWDPSPFGSVLTPLPDSGIVDFTHPQAYAWWRDAHRTLFEQGVDMIKADFGEQLDSEHMLAHNGDSGQRLHNAYALLYNRCVYEAAERYARDGAFLFSRAAWAGSQRYPSQWGGDPQADWQGLAASLRGALSWGLSGGPFYTSDVGGFYRDTRDPVLYVRWLQLCIFSAHLRLHGVGQREPWSYGSEADTAAMQALRLRYRLLPYLRECVAQSCRSGLPLQRAMVLAFPQEPQSWSFEHQFMCGDKLLVVPCTNPEGEIEFYLPQGEWLRFPDQSPRRGGRYHRECLELTEIAVFVRQGEVLPLGPEREWIEDAIEPATQHWRAGPDG